MLDLGFREDLEFILEQAPKTRRTLLFSATVPPMIATLAKSYQKDAVRIASTSKESQHSDIEYRALSVANHDIDAAIVNVLRYYDAPNSIVFCQHPCDGHAPDHTSVKPWLFGRGVVG